MSHAASTVSVVTTDGPGGRAGATVSAMSSVSADPPSLLVCVHHMSRTADAIRINENLCVNLLREDQTRVSDTFAGRNANDQDKFDCAEWITLKTGAPVLRDALVSFDCELKHHFQWGSHFIFIAEINDMGAEKQGHPLIYANRAYGIPAKINRFSAQPSSVTKNAIPTAPLHIGCFVTLGPFFMPTLLRTMREEWPEIMLKVSEGNQEQLVAGLHDQTFDAALLYDTGLNHTVKSEIVTQIPPHVLLPSAHPLARQESISLFDLHREPMILLDISPSRDYFTSLFAEAGLEPEIAFHSPSFEMVRGMVANGLGYSLLVTKPSNSMSYDGKALVTRPLTEDVTPGRIAIARNATAGHNSNVEKFTGYCRRFFNNPLTKNYNYV